MNSGDLKKQAEEGVKIYVPKSFSSKAAESFSDSDEVKIYPQPDELPLKPSGG